MIVFSKKAFLISVSAIMLTSLHATSARAQDGEKNVLPPEQPNPSFELLLQKAAEEGLIELKRDSESRGHISKQTLSISEGTANESKSLGIIGSDVSIKTCELVAKTNPEAHANVVGYAAIARVKSDLQQKKTDVELSDVSLTYLALGMGAEVIRLTAGKTDAMSQMLSAQARVITGAPTLDDINFFQSTAGCSETGSLWASFAKVSHPNFDERGTVTLNSSTMNTVDNWPPVLQKLALKRLAIHSAEAGQPVQAERIFSRLSPQSQYGDIPNSYDDELLYLFALVRASRGDSRALGLLRSLAQRDGIYRMRALKELVSLSEKTGTVLPDDITNDFLEIERQYQGQNDSLAATLEVVRLSVDTGYFNEAIKRARERLKDDTSERKEAVEIIGRALLDGLNQDGRKRRLNALSSYIYGKAFLEAYNESERLRQSAFTSALDLNMPELSRHIGSSDPSLLAIAHASILLKKGEYLEVLKILEALPDTELAEPIRLAAALEAGSLKAINDLINDTEASTHLDEQYIHYCIKNGLWPEAKAKIASFTINNNSEQQAGQSQHYAIKKNILEFIGGQQSALKPYQLSQKINNLNERLLISQTYVNHIQDYLEDG